MAFKAGHFYFPTSGGSFFVDTDDDPQAVILFGSNQAVEDTLQTGGNPGFFFGMIWRTVGSGAIDYQSQTNTTFGVHWQQKPVTCASSGTGIDYEASSGSLDTGGFTLNVTTPAPGSRLCHYLSISDLDDLKGASIGSTSQGAAFDYALGYRPLSTLMFSMFALGAVRNNRNGAANFLALGVANFPDYDTHGEVDDWNNNGGAMCFNPSRQDFIWCNSGLQFSIFDTAITQSVSSTFAQGYTDQFDHMFPTPSFISETARVQLFMYDNRSSVIFLPANGSSHGVSTPALGGTNVYTAREYIDDVEAVLFFGTTGYDELTSVFSGHTAFSLGVLTPDYQGCVGWNSGIRATSPAFFQSRQACYIDELRDGGVRVASGEIQGNDVVLTGEIEGQTLSGGASGVAQMWGPDVPLQQFFRII